MAQNTKIEWAHHTVNLWWGCTEVHKGCDNCYARTLANRWGKNVWGNSMPRKIIKSAFTDLDKYQRLAEHAGELHTVFVGSMMDIFEKPISTVENHLDISIDIKRNALFYGINMGFYPNLIFLFLTKRPSNINKYIPQSWLQSPPNNVLFGCSVSDSQSAEKLIPQLLQVNGKKFLSIEPQLEEINLTLYLNTKQIDWVINGGESGHGKRPFDIRWAYLNSIQCYHYGVPFFFKQIDKVQAIPQSLMIREVPEYFKIKNQAK